MVNSSSRSSCRELFKELQILTLHSQYIYSLLTFVIKNRYLLKSNSDVHNLTTWYNSDLHFPTAKLTIFQKGVFYSGIKMYSPFPQSLKELSHDCRRVRLRLKRILLKKKSSILWRNMWVVNLMTGLDSYKVVTSYLLPILSRRFKHGCCYVLHTIMFYL